MNRVPLPVEGSWLWRRTTEGQALFFVVRHWLVPPDWQPDAILDWRDTWVRRTGKPIERISEEWTSYEGE